MRTLLAVLFAAGLAATAQAGTLAPAAPAQQTAVTAPAAAQPAQTTPQTGAVKSKAKSAYGGCGHSAKNVEALLIN